MSPYLMFSRYVEHQVTLLVETALAVVLVAVTMRASATVEASIATEP